MLTAERVEATVGCLQGSGGIRGIGLKCGHDSLGRTLVSWRVQQRPGGLVKGPEAMSEERTGRWEGMEPGSLV